MKFEKRETEREWVVMKKVMKKSGRMRNLGELGILGSEFEGEFAENLGKRPKFSKE